MLLTEPRTYHGLLNSVAGRHVHPFNAMFFLLLPLHNINDKKKNQ